MHARSLSRSLTRPRRHRRSVAADEHPAGVDRGAAEEHRDHEVRDGETGWLVSPGNSDLLAEAMIAALRAPDEVLAAMGRQP